MNANTMELNMEEMEQVTGGGGLYTSGSQPDYQPSCYHSHAVKTSWEREDEFFIFWTRHQFAYLCPDCKKIFWVNED